MTNKPHYNPCFWTAFWNTDYLNNFRHQKNVGVKAREVLVKALSLKNLKIRTEKTASLFIERNGGIAELNESEVLDYCLRYFPEHYSKVTDYYRTNTGLLLLNIENKYTGIENSVKDSLEQVIKIRKIPDIKSKTEISIFIYLQKTRNIYYQKKQKENFENNGLAKFERLLHFINIYTDRDELMSSIIDILSSKWTLYRYKKPSLILGDKPIIEDHKYLWIAIAPDLLLKIDLSVKVPVEFRTIHKSMFNKKEMIKYNRLTYETSENSIIGTSEKQLIKISGT